MGELVVRTVEGWELASEGPEGEPLIRDIELGTRLGFSRPRDVRALIERLVSAGKLNDIHQRGTVSRWEGQVAPRPVTEYWLTEAQALKVAAKSETDVADALLDEMIRVFMLARRGLLAPPPALSAEEVRAVVRAELNLVIPNAWITRLWKLSQPRTPPPALPPAPPPRRPAMVSTMVEGTRVLFDALRAATADGRRGVRATDLLEVIRRDPALLHRAREALPWLGCSALLDGLPSPQSLGRVLAREQGVVRWGWVITSRVLDGYRVWGLRQG